MCKNCQYNPYFAGRTLVFTLPERVNAEEGPVEIDGERSTGYFGVCVRHHKGRIVVRTKREEYPLDEDQILAYSLKEGEQ